ncbi:MAG: ComF family protein [Ruminococcus sp.]|nr:ComF family protein [Ruminococcus sp.]
MNSKFIRFILNIFYPSRCPVYGSFIGYNDDFCEKCKDSLNIFKDSFTIAEADGTCASFIYDEHISPAIMLLKDGICGNADFALGNALAQTVSESGFAGKANVIIPVPLHKRDKFSRGYNQVELIAKQMSAKLKIPVCFKAVEKVRHTSSQKSLTNAERLTNLSGAFAAARPELIQGKSILLIDDVCTTGATLSELTRLLKENNASQVFCACCCKTEINKNEGDSNGNQSL